MRGKACEEGVIRFFVFGDLHYGEIPDGDARLEKLAARAKAYRPDFILSLGDFCPPAASNRRLLRQLESVGVPVYHTVGNHDTDCCPLPVLLDFLGMDRPYYAFELEGVAFIVLSACYMAREDTGLAEPFFGRNYKTYRGGGGRYPLVPPEELAWLDRKLSGGKRYVIFSHHSLVNGFRDRGVCNREEVRALFQGREVLLCMNGHDHGDDFQVVDGVPYYLVNSASYCCGSRTMVPERLKPRYGDLAWLQWKEPLSVCVEIEGGELRIIGMESGYLSVTPEDVELPGRTWDGVSIEPRTSSYRIPI